VSDCSEHKNPLQHNGTSQPQRLLDGMKKDYVLVDEKKFADWIVFANEFAAFINYYGVANAIAGNWQPFFSNDIAAQLGSIAIQDIENYRLEIKKRFDFIKNDDNKSSVGDIKIKLNELFSAILTVSKALDENLLKLPATSVLKGSVQNLIKTKLSPALKNLIAYYKAAKTRSYLDPSSLSSWKILNRPLTDAAQVIDTDGLGNDWLYDTTETSWNAYKGTITEDDSVFNNPLTAFADDYLSIAHAANHNLFSGIFDIYLTTYTKIIRDAEGELLNVLESFDAHTPHYALFLSFLKLYRFVQTNINSITHRHLDFYYKEILRLLPAPAQVNKAHILVELAKQVNSYLLPAGTELKAGKDSLNRDVTYALDADTVFNKAKVAQLKSFYKANNGDSILVPETLTVKQQNEGRVFASPATNTEDGLGAKLTSLNKEWHPYVHRVYKEATLDSIAMPEARLGFAMASHYLYLTEGERKVFLRFVLNNNSALNGKNLECWLTAKKGWHNAGSLGIASSGKKLSDNTTSCAEISFTIPGSAPAIVNYDAAVHGGTYNCVLPMLKIYLVHDDGKKYDYDSLKDIIVTKIEIRVEVGMDVSDGNYQKGLKNLLLSNDFGVLDASKPFMPFGSQPKKDTGFVIGHKEIFSKKNAAVKLNIEWADLPADVADIKYDANNSPTIANKLSTVPAAVPKLLESGIWKSHSQDVNVASTATLFNGTQSQVQVTVLDSGKVISPDNITNYQDDYINVNAQTLNGFLNLTLNDSFGHAEYIKDLSLSLIEKAPSVTKTISNTPIEPYTPKIKSIYASYSAFCINDLSSTTENIFSSREIKFFHIYPFGEGEQHKYLHPSSDVSLLPQFKNTGGATVLDHIGEFYIGLEKLSGGESVNILFQVMEGTTDPNVAKPADHIRWFYLTGNEWTEFKSDEYSDHTLQLVQSGIISFAIPASATTNNSILPAGYIWLKGAIAEAPGAICELISVDAQAAIVTFVNRNNADDFLDNALPAGVISKLKQPDVAVKTISQPYPSFGGRPKEMSGHFYIRVSERLRHKARAITIWDYEHLVLQAFPEIYKVKCLNHTQIADGKYNEVSPGYVSIITIPSLKNRNDANPLKPYTQQSILTNIENYLRKRTSCFVNLHAAQPQFEEIRMEFTLTLYKEYKDFTFYSNKLKTEITQFLSPWAFGSSSVLEFGGKVYKSVLINFIEERYYVDFISDVKMFVKLDDVTNESDNMEEITASTSRSILVSAPASKHTVNPPAEIENKAGKECPALVLFSNKT
jgi:hypothetical protein